MKFLKFLSMLFFFLLLMISKDFWGEEVPLTISVFDCINRALKHNNEIKISSLDELINKKRLEEAKSYQYLPKFEFKSYFGPVPDAEGDIFESSNDDNIGVRDFTKDLGYFTKMDLELFQPIYTFGRISSIIKAASSGVKAASYNRDHIQGKIIKEVLTAYFGLVLIENLLDILFDSRKSFDKAVDKLESLLTSGSDKVKETDRFKLKIYEIEMDKNEKKLNSEKTIAKKAIKILIGWPNDKDFTLKDLKLLKLDTLEILTNELLVKKAWENNSQLRALNEGINAKLAQLSKEKADFFPLFFIAGGLKYSYAPGRTDQTNPFVRDDFNYFAGGIFLGLKQDLNLWSISKNYRKIELETKKILEQKKLAEQGITLLISKVIEEKNRYDFDAEKNKDSIKTSRVWLSQMVDAFENFGDVNVRDVTDAFFAYVKARTEYYISLYNYNLTLFELGHIINEDVTKERYYRKEVKD